MNHLHTIRSLAAFSLMIGLFSSACLVDSDDADPVEQFDESLDAIALQAPACNTGQCFYKRPRSGGGWETHHKEDCNADCSCPIVAGGWTAFQTTCALVKDNDEDDHEVEEEGEQDLDE